MEIKISYKEIISTERSKGEKLAENIKGRIHEAETRGQDTIGIDSLVQVINEIYRNVDTDDLDTE